MVGSNIAVNRTNRERKGPSVRGGGADTFPIQLRTLDHEAVKGGGAAKEGAQNIKARTGTCNPGGGLKMVDGFLLRDPTGEASIRRKGVPFE